MQESTDEMLSTLSFPFALGHAPIRQREAATIGMTSGDAGSVASRMRFRRLATQVESPDRNVRWRLNMKRCEHDLLRNCREPNRSPDQIATMPRSEDDIKNSSII